MAVAAPVRNSIRADKRAGVATVTLREALEKGSGGWKVRALQVAALGTALLGGIGIGGSLMIERHKNAVVADNKKEVIADYMRDVVAAQLGMSPAKVTVKDLERARANPAIRQLLEAVERDKSNENRAAIMAAGGAMAVGGFVPGLSGLSYMAAHGAGAIAGGIASTFFNKDTLTTIEVTQYIDEKHKAGQAITAGDVVLMRIAHNEPLQKELKKINGVAFHKMEPAAQQAVIRDMPGMADAQDLADDVNKGFKTAQDIIMAASAKPGWSAKAAAQRASRGGSFTEMVEQRRAAALAGGINGPAA